MTVVVSITSTVVRGNQLGRELGFPTANVTPPVDFKLPNGVYAAEVIIAGSRFQGMANVGVRPTVTHRKERLIEVHLFDFNEDLYGKTIQILFGERLREERSFPSLEALRAQLQQDEKTIKNNIK